MNALCAAGIPLDISLGALPFEARVIERASPYEPVDGAVVTTRSAEDLLVRTASPAGLRTGWTSRGRWRVKEIG